VISPFSITREITPTLNTVLIPRVAALKIKSDLVKYLKDSFLITSLAVLFVIGLIIFSKYIIVILYGEDYLSSVAILRVFLIAYAMNILVWPFLLLIHSFDRPDIQTKVNVLQIPIQVIGTFILIPTLGAIAPALMFLIITVIGIVITSIWISIELYRRREIDEMERLLV